MFHGRLEKEGYVYFKFEPFILHVMCATVSDAKLLVREGGGAFLANIDLPLSCRQQLVVVFVIQVCLVVRERDGW